MNLISEPVRKLTAARLDQLPNPVKLVVFTQEMECAHCRENRQLAEEIAGLSGRLSLEVYNLLTDREKAAEFGVDKVPATAIIGERDYGIRYYGVPAGFEFTSLLGVIELAGRRDSGLKPETRLLLSTLSALVDLQVFVTLTCPNCPPAAILAARLAVENPHISAGIIDAGEFPHLAGLHSVMAVPKTVVNRTRSFEGARPEEQLANEVLSTASPTSA